ncbi:MAG: histidine kinase dimerization/phosphoacceptor domain -containing protein [Gemmataceae bacterium]
MGGGPPYRILLVDGCRQDRETFCRFLNNSAGNYLYVEAGTGKEGLYLLRTHAPDCVLLDYWLPDMDGFEFVEALRASPPDHEPPIVMITGQGSETVAVEAMAKGISDYVPKGLLTPRALCRIVANVIEKATWRRLFDEQRCELRRRERELADFAENAPLGLQWLSADGVILWANRATVELLGYPDEELIGRRLAGFHPEPDLIDDLLARLRRNETVRDFETSLRCRDGQLKHLLIDANVFWEGQRFVHSRCFLRDLTERKQAELRLKNTLVEKELLLQEVRHRVKNNLQVIISLLGLQAEQLVDESTRKLFRDTENRVRSMALTHEMLYAAPDLGKIDVAEYLRTLTGQLAHSLALEAQGITLDTQVDEVYLSVDTAIPCGLIVNELVSNALKHAFAKGSAGKVRVQLRAQGPREYELCVSDTGRGLPGPVDFRQVRSLGLQLVATLAEQLRGTIAAEAGNGTTFRVRFHEVEARRRR